MKLKSIDAYRIANVLAQTGMRGALPGSQDERQLQMTLQNSQAGLQTELQKEAAKEAEEEEGGILGEVGALAGGTVGFMVGGPPGAAAGAALGGAGGRAADGEGFDIAATGMDALTGYMGAKAVGPTDQLSADMAAQEAYNAAGNVGPQLAPPTPTMSMGDRALSYANTTMRGSYVGSMAPQFSSSMWGGGLQTNGDNTYSYYPPNDPRRMAQPAGYQYMPPAY